MIAVDKLDVPVLIFDEVDAGVGGAIAEVVGRELRNIGDHRQVHVYYSFSPSGSPCSSSLPGK